MNFLKAWRDEWGLYLYDKWLLLGVTLFPLILFILSAHIFGSGVVRDIHVGVVDRDNSTLSRELVRYFNSSDILHVNRHFLNEKDGIKAMRNAQIYALIVIPSDMEKDIKKGLSPTVGSYYNTQFVLIGRSIKSTLEKVVATYNAKILVGKTLFRGDVKLSQAFGEAIPIQQQITPLYNIGFSYSQFLLSVILPCVWQIIMVSTLVLNFSAQERKTSIGEWLRNSGFKGFFVKLFVHQIFMFFWCISFIVYFYMYLGWAMNGSFSYLLLAGFLTILASQAMGSLFYFTAYDAPRSISAAAAYTAPSLAFVGITFPFSDMAPFAQVWHKLLPVSHYLSIQISQANYGADIGDSMDDFLALLAFNMVFFIVFLSIRLVGLKRGVREFL